MKALFTLAIAAALALANTQTAEAGSKEKAIVGGVIGGLIIGSILDDHHNDRHHSNVSVSYRSNSRHHHTNHSDGYYKTVSVRVWVPGYWDSHYDDCGVRVRHYVRGHYTYRKDRVWVSHSSRNRHYSDSRYSRHGSHRSDRYSRCR